MATIQNDTRDAALDALTALLDGGYVEVRTGAPPADPDDPAGGTLLATIALNSPAFGASVDGAAAAVTTPELADTGVADGSVGWCRAYSVTDDAVMDIADAEVSDGSVSTGLPVRITSLTLTLPDGS